MIVAPPVERHNESAGYLGYYTRTHLAETFDLVDVDGASPAVWIYRKAETETLRIIEEKPSTQQMHASQHRTLRYVARLVPFAVYVLYGAERLVAPEFPVEVHRLGATELQDRRRSLDRPEFDAWLTDGLASPMSLNCETTWDLLTSLTGLPFAPRDLPPGVDWGPIDKALTVLAQAMAAALPDEDAA